ncbi:MAG: hypothetical protein WCW44_01370 [archaeon]|jgi:hypothetical protein
MTPLVYGFFLLGSFPLGYALLRAGFPSSQKKGVFTKLAIGYFLGSIVFAIPLALIYVFTLGAEYFALASLVTFALFFIVMYTKRISFKETDPIIPKIVKPKNVPAPQTIDRETPPKKIVFETGLMVKTKEEPQGKKQVFKEKEDTILSALAKKTNEIESKNQQQEKNAALEKLRQSAQQIKEKAQIKKKSELAEAEDMDEIEEGLLNEITKDEEEEY